jgi:hypothetical protein
MVAPVSVIPSAQLEAELFAHHTSDEAADRALLPMARAHDGGKIIVPYDRVGIANIRASSEARSAFVPRTSLVFALSWR